MNKIKDNPRIVIFFVTYKNNFVLEKSLSSINLKQIEKYNPEIYIINNSANFPIIFNKNVAVPYKLLNNNLRVDFSTGHLARNWNQCLIHGFQNLKDPKNDIVLCCQNDVLFKENFLDLLIKNHQKYNFVTYGHGDAAHSYTSEAVRNVGDGSTTFNIPDLRGRTSIGAGQGGGLTNRTLGQTLGTEQHILTVSEMPAHTHNVQNNSPSSIVGTDGIHTVQASATTSSIALQTVGGTQPHNNIQPSAVLNKIIKT